MADGCTVRVQPIPVRDWPQAMRDAMAAMTPPSPRFDRPKAQGRPKAMNILGALAHHPDLARAFFTLNGHLLRATTLTERQRELVILRTAAVRRSSYEWAQHIFLARDAGVTDAELAWIAWGADAPFWDESDAALLGAVDDLIRDGVIGETNWTVLTAHLEVRQILDMIFTVGVYEALGWMLQSFGIGLDDDIRSMLARGPDSEPAG